MSPRPVVLRAGARGALSAAAAVLHQGGVVAFPTETVYGLAVRTGDPAARSRLVRVKGRPEGKPFQLLVGSPRHARRLCREWPLPARRLARAFWPGPLTLVALGLNRRYVGLRVPDHAVARKLIVRAGGALVATSANRSGRPPATRAEEVIRDLGARVDLLLDGGPAGFGKASSVVKVQGARWTLLREGAITRERLTQAVEGTHARKRRTP